MLNEHGYGEKQWEVAKAEMTRILQETASQKAMVSYSELSARTRSLTIHHHSPAMRAMLGQISRAEDRAGRGMLTVIVVHKVGDMEPGKGFYELAKELGRDWSDQVKFWVDELHRVHGYWAQLKRPQ